MKIMSIKPGHDGAVALVEDGNLVFSLEAEKDSYDRYAPINVNLLLRAMEMTDSIPDVLAIGGWHKNMAPYRQGHVGAGYHGIDNYSIGIQRFFGRNVRTFSSSHERSHIYMAIGMAPSEYLRQDCAILVWEGRTGAVYIRRRDGSVHKVASPLQEPGARWGALYAIADPTFPDRGSAPRFDYAGKLMALAGIPAEPASEDVRITVDYLLNMHTIYPFNKLNFSNSPLYNVGPNTPIMHSAAKYLMDRIYDIFRNRMHDMLPVSMPLLINGGCGLNCDWNRKFAMDPRFPAVFVPPCTNDSGSAIGTAIDAQRYFTDQESIAWSVYSGEDFVEDQEPSRLRWRAFDYSPQRVARAIENEGAVVAWVQGRAEIGPRALGHRSLLASAVRPSSHDRLNKIKDRESYRPIAPVCAVEDVSNWFSGPVNPHMLFTMTSRFPTDLPAVTHADRSARVQALSQSDEPRLHELLHQVAIASGPKVLCNTSLNFNGRGFINRTSDLDAYCRERGVDIMVIGDRMWTRP